MNHAGIMEGGRRRGGEEEGRWGGGGGRRGGGGEVGGRRGWGEVGEGYSHESWSLCMGSVSLCYRPVVDI